MSTKLSMLPGTVATRGCKLFLGYVGTSRVRFCDSMAAYSKLQQLVRSSKEYYGKHNEPCVSKHVQRCSKQS